MSRQKNSFLNMSANFLILLTNTFLSFAVRTVFIRVLGEQYLGVTSLFSNILQVLSIAELGVGTAINYALYDPLARKDYTKVSVILGLFKKIYKIVGMIIAAVGLILVPFLPTLMKGNTVPNTLIIYLLYLFNTVSMYFISYKDTLITADQKYYKLARIVFLSNVTIYVSQILVLVLFKSFVLYFGIQIVVTLVQRILCNILITNNYSHIIDFNSKEKVDKEELDNITTNVKAMFFHKIGYNIVNCTDNIIISAFINVATVGVYTNYLSLTTMINSLFYSIFTSVTSSFGNLAALESKETQENVFNKLNFLAFAVFGYATLCFLVLLKPFVTVWIGEKYVLATPIIIAMCINFYLNGIKAPLDTVKEAAGIYKQDQFIPLCQAITNLILSIILVQKLGLIGVVLGTIISYLLFPFWNRPYTVYKYVFNKGCKGYFIDALKKILIIIGSYLIIAGIISFINIESVILTIAVRFVICSIIYIFIITLLYRKDDNYKFYLNFIKKKVIR